MYDPESEVYIPDVAFEAGIKSTPSWYNDTFDFANFCERDIVASHPFQTEEGSLPHNLAKLSASDSFTFTDEFDRSQTELPRMASPVPESLADADDYDDDASYEPHSPIQVPVNTPKTVTPTAPKKVASNSKVSAKAKDKAKKFKEEHKAVFRSEQGSILTEEERKERNKIAAQKYRQKCREQASSAEIRSNELAEEQKILLLQIAQEREKIREIRELLQKHNLLPVSAK